MDTPFLSSEEYDERAHQLYNEGRYDAALQVLREGLGLYPHAVELHVGVGYARLAREEFGWARRAFEEALVLDPEHEDALAGLGEALLRFMDRDGALRCFRKVLSLHNSEDPDLVLQCGRALFREGMIVDAREFFDAVLRLDRDHADALSLKGYCEHRLGEDARAVRTLRRALARDPQHSEARIYLANILYDQGDHAESLAELDATSPEDHWDELAIWRLLELSVMLRGAREDDPDLVPWHQRLLVLNEEPDATDALLEEIEERAAAEADSVARGQLELFGAMLADLSERTEPVTHRVELRDGRVCEGTWEEIVHQMRGVGDPRADRTLQEFMQSEARRASARTGMPIPASDAESFIRASASAGLLRIVH